MPEGILNTAFGFIIVCAATAGAAWFHQWLYSSPTRQKSTYYVTTSDGLRLALHRYGAGESKGVPVILCHGLSSNRYTFDLEGAPSLARYLAIRGYDVWSVELRGAGMSDKPGLCASDVPYSWTFDDHLEKDVPALVNGVLQLTGAERVHWIGHSMGGMLIMAHLSRNPDAPVQSATAVGSPTDFSKVNAKSFDLLLRARGLFAWLPFFPMTIVGKALTPIAHRIPERMLTLFHLPNTAPGVVRRSVAAASQFVTSNRIWMQFGGFLESGDFASPDDESYIENLPNSPVPLLLLAGTRDVMAPVESVIWPCRLGNSLGSRRCAVLGKSEGCEENYGHLDMLLGKRAESEVYPLILEHLRKHDPVKEPSISASAARAKKVAS